MKIKIHLLICGIMTVYASNSQTKECVEEYIKELKISHPEIVLKQAILETGNFTSYGSKIRHNLFGATDGKGNYLWFDSWQESVRWYARWQSKHYSDCSYGRSAAERSEAYFRFLECVKKHKGKCAASYAEDPLYINKLKKIKL